MKYLISNNLLAALFLAVIGLGLGACSERNYPEEVGEGVARLSVSNLASLLQGVNALPRNTEQPECNLGEFKFVKGKTTTILSADGQGSMSIAFNCMYDFGPEGTTLESEGECGGKTTYYGKLHVVGVKQISGLLTENPDNPVIPSGAQNSMKFEFSSVLFDNYKVESSGRKEAMTMVAGKVAYNIEVHLAKSCDSKMCRVPLPNPTLSNIRFSEKAFVKVPGPRGIFEAEINGSDFGAQVGEHNGVSNELSGSINVWGKKVRVPKDGSKLDPDFSPANHQKSLMCIKDLKQPVEQSCSYEQEIVDVVSRLTVHNVGHLFDKLVRKNTSSIDQRPECDLWDLKTDPETQMTDAKKGYLIWRFNNCVYDFGKDEDAPFSGKVTISGSKSVFGRVTQSKLFPVDLEKPEITWHFEKVDLDNFAVNSEFSKKKAQLKHTSGSVAFEVAVHLETETVLGRVIPKRTLSNITIKNINYLGSNKVNLSIRDKKLQTEIALNIQASNLHAQLGEFEGNEDKIEGKVRVFDKWLEVENTDLRSGFQDQQAEEAEQSSSEGSQGESTGKESGPNQETKAQEEMVPNHITEKAIRTFFSEILVTPRSHRVEIPQNQFRATLLRHSETLYWVIKKPELISQAGVPQELEAWFKPLSPHLKGASAAQFHGIIEFFSEEEVANYYEKVQENIRDFKIQGFEGLLKIEIPDGLGDSFKRFLKNVIAEYFPQLDPVDKKRIFSSLLMNTTSQSNEIDRLLAIVYASGPFFQKLMQLLSDKLEPGPMKEALESLKSKLPSIEKDDIDEYLRQLRTDKDGPVELKIVRSLGAASVGEALLADQTLRSGEKQRIVVKFMRPGIEDIANREKTFFMRQAELISPTMKITFAQISKQIFDELDLTRELANLKRAVEVYNDASSDPSDLSGNIVTVKPIQFPENKYWMAMHFVDGKTLRDTRGLKSDPKMTPRRAKVEIMAKAFLMDALVRKFVRKSLFPEPDGYFHGDLHGGNTIIWISPEIEKHLDAKGITAESLTKENVRELLALRDTENEPLIKLILIDFGNSHVLLHHDRVALFNLLISAADLSNSPTAFLKAVQALSHGEQKIDIEALTAEIKHLFVFEEKFSAKIGKSIDILQQKNVFVPGIIVAYYRSIDLLGNSFAQLREDGAFHNVCLSNLNMETGLRDEIVDGILGGKTMMAKVPTAWHYLRHGELPDIIGPENFAAMKPHLPEHIRGWLSEQFWGGQSVQGANDNRVCEMAW